MPDPPVTNLLTRYILENPWPLGFFLGIIGVLLLYRSLRQGLWSGFRWGLGFLLSAGIIIGIGLAVRTPGEQGKALIRSFVTAALAGDVRTALSFVADDVTLHRLSGQGSGRHRKWLLRRLADLDERVEVDSWFFMRLRGYTLPGQESVVQIACVVHGDAAVAGTHSEWEFYLRPGAGGEPEVYRIIWISMNLRQPPTFSASWG